jgi:hypothetical protein
VSDSASPSSLLPPLVEYFNRSPYIQFFVLTSMKAYLDLYLFLFPITYHIYHRTKTWGLSEPLLHFRLLISCQYFLLKTWSRGQWLSTESILCTPFRFHLSELSPVTSAAKIELIIDILYSQTEASIGVIYGYALNPLVSNW